ncbi:SIR2 family protein [Pseudarthrobacter sp. PS3-L1]|uniref:P-loop NTPase n=1 Tax=Pseudarthrobacter sp. PS3-L1 TaxID=3046207 RepID=UPI0024BAE35D|nr:SIR2 family protein [Pseudarthrobacter sp. PS3-L1]MDJ0321953.1 SIR2 family protein [Pseudarthrobacter sp. PS3-L1]
MSVDSGNTSVDISDQQRLALRRAARNGDYHLMLGAGSSLDSTGPQGAPLPNSGQLIEKLCRRFGVLAEDDDRLWRVYDRAVESAGEAAVYEWFRQNFWNVVPPYWMAYYARSPWSSVWTLNVDDTFEAAHRSIVSDTKRTIQSLNWDDSYRHGRQLNVIHLHGIVDHIEPRKLIFSLTEYTSAGKQDAAWPVNFRDSYGNSPFVILGARMRDEPDIEAVISRRRPTHLAPSFYVASTISPATRADLIRWGLVPIEMTAEDFVLEWAELTGLDLEKGISSDMELGMRVTQEFSELRSDITSKAMPNHDFLGGDEPLWEDIQNGLAADLQWVSAAKTDCNQIGQTIAKSAVLAYAGRRLSGRSTGLLMLARHLRSASWRTFLFRENGRLDIEAILGFASSGAPVALFFDGMSAVADDIDKLISGARGAGLSIVCVAVDDADREATILGRIRANHLAHSRIAKINGRLTGVDASRLVDTLGRVGRLGILESMPDRRRLEHFKRQDLFVSMAQLENAPGFGQRVGDLISGVTDQQTLSLVLIAAFASQAGGHLLVIDAARMVGMESDELVRRVASDPQLSALLLTDTSRVKTRHRWMALQPVVDLLGPARAADIVRDAIRRVSVRLSRRSLQERNPTSLLVGLFMSHRRLNDAFPDVDLDSWYESLLPVFGTWSGRYWEQRAILARKSDPSQLAKAESFALRAAEIVPDTYSLTTLGTVLLEKAARAQVDVEKYYERGNAAFERAVRLDSSTNSLVTWIAFLRFSLKVLQRLSESSDSDPVSEETRDLMGRIKSDWSRTYSQIGILRDSGEEVSGELAALRRSFETFN